jgi:hypothetical protein
VMISVADFPGFSKKRPNIRKSASNNSMGYTRIFPDFPKRFYENLISSFERNTGTTRARGAPGTEGVQRGMPQRETSGTR